MEEEKNLQKGAEDTGWTEEKGGLHAVRTFKDDSSRYIKEKRISLIDVAAAQSKKKSFLKMEKGDARQGFGWKKISFLIFAVIFISAAGFGVFYLVKNKEAPGPKEIILPKPPIIADIEKETAIGGLRAVLGERIGEGSLAYIPVVVGTEEARRLITAREFFNYFGILPPSDLLGDLEDNFSLYAFSSSKNFPVLIFEIKSYDRIFAGMLRWESIIIADFQKIFPANSGLADDSSSFKDKEIANHDARIKYDSSGNAIFAYSLLNRKYLIISMGEGALEEIFRRFSSSKFIND